MANLRAVQLSRWRHLFDVPLLACFIIVLSQKRHRTPSLQSSKNKCTPPPFPASTGRPSVPFVRFTAVLLDPELFFRFGADLTVSITTTSSSLLPPVLTSGDLSYHELLVFCSGGRY